MTREEVFAVWSPPEAAWSQWVKPVLFAHIGQGPSVTVQSAPQADVTWAPTADGRNAVVVDLAGPTGVWIGLALARRGYRPVPLYNAAPGPQKLAQDPSMAVVAVHAIMLALFDATPLLRDLRLPPDAPPAFLLDADRRTGRGVIAPGRFDNRSISFPTDFPSANFLLSRGISGTVLVQDSETQPQADLAHTLRRWQDAGIAIAVKRLSAGTGEAEPVSVRRPSFYRRIWYRMLALAGLRRNPLGGFGGMLPEPSGG